MVGPTFFSAWYSFDQEKESQAQKPEKWKTNESSNIQHVSLVFQNPPVIPCEDRCLGTLKAEPQESGGVCGSKHLLIRYLEFLGLLVFKVMFYFLPC